MITVLSKSYEYRCDVRDNDELRQSFNNLAEKTFKLSFEKWYKDGWWQDKYIPHILTHNGTAVANVSVNIIDALFNGEKKSFIQLGTVMTDEKYRCLGLSRFLMEAVLDEWIGKCDGIYLYANDSVLDFYPRFGFTPSREYQCSLPVTGRATAVKCDSSLLLEKYQSGNPFSALQTVHGEGLLMFYCSQLMKDCIYFCEESGAVVIADAEGSTVTVYDVFAAEGRSLDEIISEVAGRDTKTALLGFSPKEASTYNRYPLCQEDTTMFIHQSSENSFADSGTMFPLLSHA